MNEYDIAEFIISKSIFLHETQYLDRFIPARLKCNGLSNKPGFLLFKVEKDKITLSGVGNDGCLQYIFEPDENNQLKINSNQSDPLYVFVPAKHCFKVIKSVRSEYLRFVVSEDETLEIWDGDSVFSLKTLDANSFPIPLVIDIKPSFSLTLLELMAITREVAFAASPQDYRKQLMGVHFKFKKDGLYCEATDSFRLSRKVFHKDGPLGVEVNIPATVINHALKIFKFHQNIDVAFDGNIVQLKDGNCIYQSECYVETYPDFDKIIPKKSTYKTTLVLNTEEVRDVLNQCTILAEPNAVKKVQLEASPEKVSICSFQKDVGYADQAVSQFEFDGEPIKIWFNAQFMLDSIRALNTHKEIMKLELIADKKPIMITKPDDPDLLLLVVPMRG